MHMSVYNSKFLTLSIVVFYFKQSPSGGTHFAQDRATLESLSGDRDFWTQ
jgi:hypothetical protein